MAAEKDTKAKKTTKINRKKLGAYIGGAAVVIAAVVLAVVKR